MGSDSDLKEENDKLMKDIERLTQLNKNVEREIETNRPALTKEQTKGIKEENKAMKEKLNNLKTKYNNLKDTYNYLTTENNQIKAYCRQLQLMFLMKMQQNQFNLNLNNFNRFQALANSYQSQINNFVNNNNNNFNNNNFNKNNCNNNNFNNNFAMHGNINNIRKCQIMVGEINLNNQNIITIIFNVENIQKYPIVTLPNYRLGNIFLLLLNQFGNTLPSDINKLRFEYNCIDVTNHFANNDEVRSLNLNSYAPIINVTRKNV